MKGLDDGPDGLNDATFDRALGGKPMAKRVTRKPAPKATKQPTLSELERAHRKAFAHELALVSALPEHAPAAQTAAAWRAAEATNAALRAVQAHPDYPYRDEPQGEVR